MARRPPLGSLARELEPFTKLLRKSAIAARTNIRQTAWININREACSETGRDCDGPYKTRKVADREASKRRVACVRVGWTERRK